MILSNYRTYLSLAIVPVAIVLGRMDGIHPGVTFTMNLLAVFPLSIVLTAATETLASDMGVIPGALLNMSCGNLAEIIILYAIPRWDASSNDESLTRKQNVRIHRLTIGIPP